MHVEARGPFIRLMMKHSMAWMDYEQPVGSSLVLNHVLMGHCPKGHDTRLALIQHCMYNTNSCLLLSIKRSTAGTRPPAGRVPGRGGGRTCGPCAADARFRKGGRRPHLAECVLCKEVIKGRGKKVRRNTRRLGSGFRHGDVQYDIGECRPETRQAHTAPAAGGRGCGVGTNSVHDMINS